MDTDQEPLDQNIQSPAQAEYQEMVQGDLTARLRSVASWFYWVAGLSLVNTLAVMMGVELTFSLGLGITQIIDAVALNFRTMSDTVNVPFSVGELVVWGVDFLILGFFVFLGVRLSRHRAAWALWLGIILYGLDSLFFFMGFNWIALALHGFVLYKLTRGFGILQELEQAGVKTIRV